MVITMKSNTSNLHLLLDSITALEKYKLFDDVYKANKMFYGGWISLFFFANSICESQHDNYKYQNT